MKREVTYCERISLIHHSGDELFPVKSLNRATGRATYRWSDGGPGGNDKSVGVQETECEDEIVRAVKAGKSVRCRTLPGIRVIKRDGMYRVTGWSIDFFKDYDVE